MLNAFTIDVEDYYQVSAFEQHVARRDWDQYPGRVLANTRRLLDLLARHAVRATFFVLGWVGRKHPELVREIQAANHEVGSHGYWHRLVYQQSPAEFRADLRESRQVLEDAGGSPITCYRAPSFSVTRRSLWALEILAEEGFTTDASIYPVRHDRYGIPDAEPFLHRRDTRAGAIWEFPGATRRLGPMRLPVAGGGYFRLYPWRFTADCLARINTRAGQPFVFYVHPWEIDADQPRLRGPSRLSRWRHYVNLAGTYRKLERLLESFAFAPVRDVVALRASQVAVEPRATEPLATEPAAAGHR